MEKLKVSRAVKLDRAMIFVFPLAVSVISYFVIDNLCTKFSFVIDSIEGLDNFKTMLSIWGTLLGFLITAISILMAFGEGKFINILKSTGHFKTILLSYIICCLHLLVAVILAVVCVFCKIWNMNLFAILCAVSIDTILMVAICLFFLFTLVLRVND